MVHSIDEMAKLSGVSTRTLRYYDQIGLLTPRRQRANGYRIYGEAEVDRLQQILFYRELGVSLEEIGRILARKDFVATASLQQHLLALIDRRCRMDALIRNVEKTLQTLKGETVMTDREKFDGFTQKLVDQNEAQYGAEISEQYGAAALARSNEKLLGMSRAQYEQVEKLASDVNEALKAAFEQGDPAGELAQRACEMHKQWLCCYWAHYSKQAHKGLGELYVNDSRFTAYYDKIAVGCAVFLRDALRIYCKE